MKNKHQPLNAGYFYHIYNRGNNRENLFYKTENYIYFLKKYDYYLNEYLETYAYCLLPNHFHLLVRVKEAGSDAIASSDGIDSVPGKLKENDAIPRRDGIDKSISEQFRRLFISYSQAINKQQNRNGSLFQKPFKRIRVENEKYLRSVLYYVHSNPQNNGLIDDFRDWPFSSYGKFIINKESHLKKEDVINWFGSVDEYKNFHAVLHDNKKIAFLMAEE